MVKNIILIFMLLLIVIISTVSVSFAERLTIANFDRGQKPNVIGGDFGSWNRSEWDRTQFCNESFTTDPNLVYGRKGCSIRLDYDVDSPNAPAYNGFWMRLEKIDLTKYSKLVFYVKGDVNFGYTTEMKAEVKSIAGDIARYRIEGISDVWQRIVLPLDVIKDEGDFTEGSEFTIVFEDRVVTEKVGRIYIDQVYVQ